MVDPQMLEFLNRILNEAGFRDLAQKDPVKAMASVGYKVPPAELKNVPKQVVLPSDEDIRALLVLAKRWDKIKVCFVWFMICGWPKP